MIYYKLYDVDNDGKLSTTSFGKRNRLPDANIWAKQTARPGARVAVVKVTEQHLGTYGSKEHATD